MKNHRSYDAEINLVPFIDLLSVCITFLLITAVWTQLGRIEMNLQSYDSGEGESAADEPQGPTLNLTVFLTKSGYTIAASVGVSDMVPKVDGKYNFTRFDEDLKKIQANFADNNKVIIGPEDEVLYEDLVEFMDRCLAHNLNDISLGGGIL